jgi:hypothetical protein
MKKLLLVGAVAVAAFAASSHARAGVSFSISLGHHYPHAPVVVAPPPVIVAPPVAAYPGHCAPVVAAPVVAYPGYYAPAPVTYVYGYGPRDYPRYDRHGHGRGHGHHYAGHSGHAYGAGYVGSHAYGQERGGLRVVANGHRH